MSYLAPVASSGVAGGWLPPPGTKVGLSVATLPYHCANILCCAGRLLRCDGPFRRLPAGVTGHGSAEAQNHRKRNIIYINSAQTRVFFIYSRFFSKFLFPRPCFYQVPACWRPTPWQNIALHCIFARSPTSNPLPNAQDQHTDSVPPSPRPPSPNLKINNKRVSRDICFPSLKISI